MFYGRKSPQVNRAAPAPAAHSAPASIPVAASNLGVLRSKVEQKTTSFIWEISGVEQLRKLNLWNTPHCEFQTGSFCWRLSMRLSSNGNVLLANPELLSPLNSCANYYVKCHVVNQQNFVVHSSPFACEKPSMISNIPNNNNNNTNQDSMKWEILRFDERTVIDQYSSLIFKDTLRLLVEFTVFVNVVG